MILNVTFLVLFVAVGVWLVVRGITLGWTTSTIFLLCIAALGVIGRVIDMGRQRRQPPGRRRSTDNLLRPPEGE